MWAALLTLQERRPEYGRLKERTACWYRRDRAVELCELYLTIWIQLSEVDDSEQGKRNQERLAKDHVVLEAGFGGDG